MHNPNTAKFKQFRQGLDQLLQEGVIQVAAPAPVREPKCRCWPPSARCSSRWCNTGSKANTAPASRLESAPWTVVRWLPPGLTESRPGRPRAAHGTRVAFDVAGHAVVLFPNEWSANYFTETNPKIPLSRLPLAPRRLAVGTAAAVELRTVSHEPCGPDLCPYFGVSLPMNQP